MGYEINITTANQVLSLLLERTQDRWERIDAVKSLVAAQYAPALEVLSSILMDASDDISVRSWIAQGFEALADQRTLDALIHVALNRDDSGYVRSFAMQALRAFNDSRAVAALLDLLRDTEDPGTRLWAASLLGQIGAQSAVDALIHALSDPESIVRAYAVSALGEIRDDRAIQPL